jgi:hypothetical protein
VTVGECSLKIPVISKSSIAVRTQLRTKMSYLAPTTCQLGSAEEPSSGPLRKKLSVIGDTLLRTIDEGLRNGQRIRSTVEASDNDEVTASFAEKLKRC